ncbi:biliverdin-producing heme oxygenase [Flavobacterium sp.]
MMHTNTETLTPIDFLDKLRSETSDLHTQLETLPIARAIVSEKVTSKNYGDYLCLMHNVVCDVELAVFPKLCSVIPDLENRRKRQWIESDIQCAFRKIVPRLTAFNDEFSVAFALGILYVVEGSTLGGRYILKNIQPILGYTNEMGARYFAGYGDKTGSHWKSFLLALTQYEKENQCSDEIISGANFAFKTIYNHLSKAE